MALAFFDYITLDTVMVNPRLKLSRLIIAGIMPYQSFQAIVSCVDT